MSLEDSAFTGMPREAIKFNQTQIETDWILIGEVHIKILVTIFGTKTRQPALRNVLVFCFGAQILIQNQIIAAGIPFFQTLLFPICLEPTLFGFQPCAISCSGCKSKQVGSNWQDKQTIPSPSFWETAAIDLLCIYIRRRIVECFLSLLLKEFMADHHKETKCSYLWHESIMIGIKEPHVDNKSR